MTTKALTAFLPLLLALGCAQGPARQAIIAEKAPKAIGPYSHAVVSGDFVFVAGQGPVEPATGQYTPADIQSETRLTFANMKTILEAAGSSLDKVVKVNVYLKDMKDFKAMNEVYGQTFKAPYPARTTVQVAALPMGIQVEIECVARR